MQLNEALVFLVIGAVAGWISGLLVKGGGFGLIGNIVVGILGAVIGGWLFGQLGIPVGGEWFGRIFTATIGAVVLLFLIRLVKKT